MTPQPISSSGPSENPKELEAISTNVEDRLNLAQDVRRTHNIETVQAPPMPHTEMTKRFYDSHDIEDPESQKTLALFTLEYDMIA